MVAVLSLAGCSGGQSVDIHYSPEAKAQAEKAEAMKSIPEHTDADDRRSGGTGGPRTRP
jgi:hypothetical protein